MLRSHNDHIRYAAQIRQVKNSLMGLSVASDQACPVYRKHDRKILKRYIMDQLVIGPLKEGRVYRKYRLHSSCRKACRKGHPMLLGDSHIKKPVRIHLPESGKPRAVCHGCGNGYNIWIPPCLVAQDFAEYIRISILVFRCFQFACLHLERAYAVKFIRLKFRRLVAFSLFCHYMKQHRTIDLPGFFKCLAKKPDIVPRYRSKISNSHILKKHSRNHQLLDAAFGPADMLDHGISH